MLRSIWVRAERARLPHVRNGGGGGGCDLGPCSDKKMFLQDGITSAKFLFSCERHSHKSIVTRISRNFRLPTPTKFHFKRQRRSRDENSSIPVNRLLTIQYKGCDYVAVTLSK